MGNKIRYPKPNTRRNLNIRQLLAVLTLIISTGLLIAFTNFQSIAIFTNKPEHNLDLNKSLASPKPHPLPPKLVHWQDSTNDGDYFSQIATTKVGYLVWSQFPIRVYVETPQAFNNKQAQGWINSVLQAVQEWNVYLPLIIVEQPEVADITIVRKAPPLQTIPGSKITRARSALTTYELYTNSNQILCHRFIILLSPSQTNAYLQAAARHELGHALGIWGHSPLKTDALYFSQVRNSPPISPRDINTLKRVYQQPTSLGWSLYLN
ncbi:peptidase [Halotia branconii]|uniref:Peptidase n=1 Tax=Halotia branconii CENA392 TaxID=1539056 RepID=A0AAJ6P8S4_9CYAN|nr:peptidase [Halotia branconii]WGV24942.1 peptidase [Halotia branconii CENA392]